MINLCNFAASTPNNVPSPVKIDVSNSATYSNGNAASTNGGKYFLMFFHLSVWYIVECMKLDRIKFLKMFVVAEYVFLIHYSEQEKTKTKQNVKPFSFLLIKLTTLL